MPMSSRGLHPDLTADGDLKSDAFLPPAQRELKQRWENPAEQEMLFGNIARWQSRQPIYTQQSVQGRTYGAGRPAHEALPSYFQDVEAHNTYLAQSWGKTTYVDDDAVARMSAAEYDEHFDAHGQPREHVYYFSNRSVALDDRMDPASRREFRR